MFVLTSVVQWATVDQKDMLWGDVAEHVIVVDAERLDQCSGIEPALMISRSHVSRWSERLEVLVGANMVVEVEVVMTIMKCCVDNFGDQLAC